MNEFKSFCPRCQGEVEFVRTTKSATCTQCGYRYELIVPHATENSGAPTPAQVLFKVFMVVGLIMGAMVVIGVGVLFVGCAAFMKGF